MLTSLSWAGDMSNRRWTTDTRLTSHSDRTSDWSSACWWRKLWQEVKKTLSETRLRLSRLSVRLHLSVFLCFCFSVPHFLSHCVSVSLLGDAGRARSAWFRAVSRRRIGSIYRLVCSGPHWPEVSVCFFSFCRSVIHLSHISWSSSYPVLPSDRKALTSSV